MKSYVLGLVLACLLAHPAHSQTAQLAGIGIGSCGKWTESRRVPNSTAALMDEQWMLGFLSAIGLSLYPKLDPLKGTDADGVWAWVDNYCRAHPIELIAAAAVGFTIAHPK